MIRIRVFADFCNFDSNVYYKIYGHDRENDIQLQFVNDNTYTHVIILNSAMPNIEHIPKENVLGMSYEPLELCRFHQEFIDYAKKHISRYFVGKIDNLPPPFEEHYTFQCHNWVDTIAKSYKNKSKIISMMVSDKQFLPGHKYRIVLAKEIIKRNLPVDIYGRGCSSLKQIFSADQHNNIKGSFSDDKEMYSDYKYHIAIENTVSNKYVSEKITNCFVHNTIPIYLGARHIDEIFQGNCCVKLTGNLEEDLNIITNIVKDNNVEKRDVVIFRNKLFNDKNVCLVEFLKSIWCM